MATIGLLHPGAMRATVGAALDARVLDDHDATAAAALKMAYAAWTKGSAALLLAAERTAAEEARPCASS